MARRSNVLWQRPCVQQSMLNERLASPVLLYRTMWGVDFPAAVATNSKHWPDFLRTKVKAHGFHGIECCSPGPFFSFAADPDALGPVLSDVGLDLVMQLQTLDYPVVSASWQAHAASFRAKCESIARLKGVMPGLINCHVGKDSMSLDDGLRFFEEALQAQRDVFGATGGPVVAFETHRQRLLHSPFMLLDMHRQAPEIMQHLRYNADLSHYVVGLERLPSMEADGEFWPQLLQILQAQAVYIHARVGTAQCIQAADPFGPEAETELRCFTEWWCALVGAMRRRHQHRDCPVRICPEYGPPPYLPSTSCSSSADATAPTQRLEETVLAAASRLKHL